MADAVIAAVVDHNDVVERVTASASRVLEVKDR